MKLTYNGSLPLGIMRRKRLVTFFCIFIPLEVANFPCECIDKPKKLE